MARNGAQALDDVRRPPEPWLVTGAFVRAMIVFVGLPYFGLIRW